MVIFRARSQVMPCVIKCVLNIAKNIQPKSHCSILNFGPSHSMYIFCRSYTVKTELHSRVVKLKKRLK